MLFVQYAMESILGSTQVCEYEQSDDIQKRKKEKKK